MTWLLKGFTFLLFLLPTGTQTFGHAPHKDLPPRDYFLEQNSFASLKTITKLGCQPDERGNCAEAYFGEGSTWEEAR